ncbi:MAG: glycoside hydrolase family 38 C-terminal domain-containing protein [Candidatus Poribacteria bacterium]|mgnify:CR=1 FL=1
MANGYKVVIVPGIHWDRAWDNSFQQNRIKLVKCVDKLIQILNNNHRYLDFTFGGQTISIEDYLEIRPEMEKELKRLIQNRKIAVGPWYTLADIFLVSPESLIRNLMFGFITGELSGKVMKVGYVPDSSGLISQLPQIMRGFGIDSIIFTRGLGDEGEILGDEFIWYSPDGKSCVLAIHKKTGDFDIQNLYTDDPFSLSRQISGIQKLNENAKNQKKTILLNADKNLAEPKHDLVGKIESLNEKLENIDITQGGFGDYINLIKSEQADFGEHRGELRGSRYHPLMTGIISSRVYLKQANEIAQTLLERWAEPFSALNWLIAKNTYPKAFLHYAWKELLKNHSHNNIRGCCIDEVHREDMTRYEWVKQIGEDITYSALENIAKSIEVDISFGYPLVVFNPLSWQRSDPIVVKIPASDMPENPIVKNSQGEIMPSQFAFNEDGVALLTFQGQVPPFGYATYYLSSSSEENQKSESHIKISPRVMENRFFRIKIKDSGTLDILDKSTGLEYKECNLYEDREDAGDAFDYSHTKHSKTITNKTAKADIKLIENGMVKAVMEIRFSTNLPKGITKDGENRTSAKMSCPFVVRVTIYENIPRIDFVTIFENKIEDHKLGVAFPTEIKTDIINVEGHFDVIKRQIDPIKPKAKWIQDPVAINHQGTFLDINDGGKGLAIINKGLHEYEAHKNRNGCTIHLTLLRCVGLLSKNGLHLHNDSPKFIPEAQCPGTHTFMYSIVAHKGDWFSAGIHRHAYEHNVSMRVIQGIFSDKDNKLQTLPPSQSFISVEPSDLMVTALKKAELGDGLILRFYNITDGTVEGIIKTYKPAKSAHLTNLNEVALHDGGLKIEDDGSIRLQVDKLEIKTVEIVF